MLYASEVLSLEQTAFWGFFLFDFLFCICSSTTEPLFFGEYSFVRLNTLQLFPLLDRNKGMNSNLSFMGAALKEANCFLSKCLTITAAHEPKTTE